jgi:uncharacterized caspase-like protein
MFYRLLVFVLFAFDCLAGAGSVGAETRLALILANGDYQHAPQLPNPTNDGALLKRTLAAQNFQVSEAINADQRKMQRAIADFASKLKQSGGDTIALLYYAGHGVQVNGINYLVPIDAEIEDETQVGIYALNADEVLKSIALGGSPLNIVVLDACRDNPFRGFRSASGGLAQMDAPTGSLIAFSTSPGKKAQDGPKGGNSPYAAALAEQLIRPGQTIEDVFKKVRKAVNTATRGNQVPWESTSLVGDFYPAGQAIPKSPDELPRTLVLDPADGTELSGAETTVRIALGASRNPTKSIRIFVNGRTVSEELAPIGGAFEAGVKPLKVPLEHGPNTIRIVTSNAKGERADVVSLVNKGVGDLDNLGGGTLYIVAVGVNRFQNCPPTRCLPLAFAAADANDFARVAANRLGTVYQRTVLRILIDQDATVANIQSSLSELRQAKANDTIIVFFSGYGLNEGGNYRYLTFDAELDEKEGKFEPRASTVISASVIQEALETANGRRFLFVDTSNSGGAFFSKLQNTSIAGQIFTFTSTQPGQEGIEISEKQHGLFTYALLEGLSGKAARPGSSFITAHDLARYVEIRVPELLREFGLHEFEQVPQYLSSASDFDPPFVPVSPPQEPLHAKQ